jgi:hypothetical protein
MSEFLEPDELKRLAGCTPVAKQDEWLTEQGIPHRVDRKRVIVSREHVRAWLEGRPLHSSNGPNWGAVA